MSQSQAAAPQQAAKAHSGSKSLSTPPVRKFAKDNKVDINMIQGTGNNGRVTMKDVELFMKGGNVAEPVQQQVVQSVAPQHRIAPLTGITEED